VFRSVVIHSHHRHVKIRSVGAQVLKRLVLSISLTHIHMLSHSPPRTHTHSHAGPAREDQKCRHADFEAHCPLCVSLTHIHTLALSRARIHTHTHRIGTVKIRSVGVQVLKRIVLPVSLSHIYIPSQRVRVHTHTHTRPTREDQKCRRASFEAHCLLCVSLTHIHTLTLSRAHTHTHAHRTGT